MHRGRKQPLCADDSNSVLLGCVRHQAGCAQRLTSVHLDRSVKSPEFRPPQRPLNGRNKSKLSTQRTGATCHPGCPAMYT